MSVLMLTYNHAAFVAQAIDSVLSQRTHFNFELLIGDDCSTDATREIVERYAHRFPEKIRLISSDTNVGIDLNHARLVAAARGRYIAYCEGDDYWNVADKLDRQVAILEGAPHCAAVHSEFASLAAVRGHWRVIPRFRHRHKRIVPQGAVFDALLHWNFIQFCTLMTRTELVRDYLQTPLASANYPAPDWPFFLYLSKRGQLAFIDEPLATYRRTAGSLMNSGDAARVVMDRSSLTMIADVCHYFETPTVVKTSALRHAWARMLEAALTAGDAQAASEALQWSSDHPPALSRPLTQRVQRAAAGSRPLREIYVHGRRLRAAVSDWHAYRRMPSDKKHEAPFGGHAAAVD